MKLDSKGVTSWKRAYVEYSKEVVQDKTLKFQLNFNGMYLVSWGVEDLYVGEDLDKACKVYNQVSRF